MLSALKPLQLSTLRCSRRWTGKHLIWKRMFLRILRRSMRLCCGNRLAVVWRIGIPSTRTWLNGSWHPHNFSEAIVTNIARRFAIYLHISNALLHSVRVRSLCLLQVARQNSIHRHVVLGILGKPRQYMYSRTVVW